MKQQPEQYLQDLAEIREMMSKSSKFLSLSGISGILIGCFAITGALLAYPILYGLNGLNGYHDLSIVAKWQILSIAVIVLLLSAACSVALTSRKAKNIKQALWGKQAKQLLYEMGIPLACGGVLSLILLFNNGLQWVFAITLVFYGLALFNAGRMTYKEIRTLGLLQIAGGLAAAILPEFGLFFWTLGFGVLHIIYGSFMHFQYERKP